MNAITLREPFATLIALGVKRFETRDARFRLSGAVAIHSGKSHSHVGLASEEPFRAHLKGYGIDKPFPFGQIIAVTRVVAVRPTSEYPPPTELERAFGDWSDGRVSVELNLRESFLDLPPIVVSGKQGIWYLPRSVVETMKSVSQLPQAATEHATTVTSATAPQTGADAT